MCSNSNINRSHDIKQLNVHYEKQKQQGKVMDTNENILKVYN